MAEVTDSDRAVCAARGGKVQPVCRMRSPACIVPNRDAGRSCTDSDQCEGRCLHEDAPTAAGGRTTGQCQADNQPCGCFTFVEDGKLEGGICVD